MILDEKPFLQ